MTDMCCTKRCSVICLDGLSCLNKIGKDTTFIDTGGSVGKGVVHLAGTVEGGKVAVIGVLGRAIAFSLWQPCRDGK